MTAIRRATTSFFLILLMGGCGAKGPTIGALRGQVRLDGKPMSNGMVVFDNADAGISLWVPLDADGRYVARSHDTPGLPVGSYRVAVRPHRAWNVDAKTGLPATTVGDGKKEPPSPIPPRFLSADTSGLTVEVQKDENPPFDIDLPAR
jgi:hypothetical protein